jgi:hypothetical protein
MTHPQILAADGIARPRVEPLGGLAHPSLPRRAASLPAANARLSPSIRSLAPEALPDGSRDGKEGRYPPPVRSGGRNRSIEVAECCVRGGECCSLAVAQVALLDLDRGR